MKESNYLYLNSPNSTKLAKQSSYRYQSMPKKNAYPINIYNFNYITKLPSSYINVFCRFRPINELEFLYSKREAVIIQSSKHLLLKADNPSKYSQEFIFDEIFEPNIHKSSFYNKTCKNIVKHAMQGFNGGIIFYGDVCSGKTYIIKEIIPQITRQIYEEIGMSDFDNEIFKIDVGIYEIYKEQINDLLELNNINLNLVELKNKKVVINNLTYITINDEEDLNNVISQGLNNKDNKIKSHCIIEFNIYRYYRDKNIMKYAKLYIVKLEGIENCSNDIDIPEEQKVINKSIDALKMVVKRLNDRNEQDEEETHIPYRNSKLTRILSDCFGGNSFTSLILTSSKSEYLINQTRNIFMFGQNVRKIKNKPLINVEVNANKNPIMKGIIMEDNKKVSNELNNLKQLNKRYPEKLDKNEMEIKELNDTIDILKFEKQNNINLHNQFNNLSKENGELNSKALYLSQKLSDEINTNQKISEDNSNLKNFTKTVMNDLISDKNYYLEQIDKYKKEKEQYKILSKEKDKIIQDLNNDLNDKKNEIFLLELQKEKISNKFEDTLYEKDEKIQNMKDEFSEEKKKMENNLYGQIKNSEMIIRELRESKSQSDNLVKKYKNNIESLHTKMKEIEVIYKNLIENNEKKYNDLEREIDKYKMQISQLTNDNYLKDSTINKMNGEIQILKTELSNIKSNNNNLLNNNQKTINNYSSKIKDLQNELDTVKLKNNNENNLINNKLSEINNLEYQLKESQNTIDNYKNKYININNDLNEARSMVINLNKEKEDLLRQQNEYKKNEENIILKDREILILNQNKDIIEKKNKEQERELTTLKKMIQNLKNDNESLRKRMNDYEEIKTELECLKNRGNNYNYIEINKTSLKQNYDKLLEENKKLKEELEQGK